MNVTSNYQSNMLIMNNSEKNVFNELKTSLETCKQFYFNVAFISYGGLQLFVKIFDDLNNKSVKGNILTSTYLNFSDPKALKKIKDFDNITMKVYDDVKNRGFHSKAYIFEYEDTYKVIIGSSNITAGALKSNIEWNVEIISKKDDPFIVDVIDEFTEIWDSLDEVTDDFLNQYEAFLNAIKEKNKRNNIPSYFEYTYDIQPNSMQVRAIENLERIRKYNGKKALVVAATGTGKTYMSAFDVKQVKPKKMLFVVHREEILRKAEESFRKVVGNNISTGFFIGDEKDLDAQYIFSTIQTLQRHYLIFAEDEFDYIIIDEAHHISGDTYQKVMSYFKPNFLLGMTATPERCDKFDIFEAFDHNVAIEVRLHEAMEESLVVPFHYFGITDIEEASLEGVNLDDIAAVAKRLKVNQRVDYIIKQMNLYGFDGNHRKCLGFCVNIDHAEFMAAEFNKRGIKSVCLTGANTPEERQYYMAKLENEEDPLEVIFTVDIFNEGIDIPSVNLVLMLRPTNSPIIFIQQLGRGLRKHDGKDYLTVLDFIGNHNRAFLIAVALKGSRYYDKDSLKVSVANEFINIPGDTFVQFDRISKERILNQLEKENFNSMRYLKQEYMSFKALMSGRIPYYLMDYIKYEGAPNPIKFINAESTYVNFLSKVEDDDIIKQLTFDKVFIKALKYLSDMLPIRRPYEFAILLDLLKLGNMSLEECKSSILKYMKFVDDDSVLHAIETLNFNYYDSSQLKRWTKFISYSNNSIELTDEIKEVIKSEHKLSYLIDTLRYGLSRYSKEFEEEYYGNPFFKLYQQYTMQDTALLSNYRKKHSSFRGNGLCMYENNYFLFVNLHKDSNIKESINYKDKFITRKIFQWQTPNKTYQTSEVGKNIIFNKERNINLHLFVRKFEVIDRQTQPYIYVGKMNVKKYEGNKPITVLGRLEHELPANLFEELTNKVEIKNDSTKN